MIRNVVNNDPQGAMNMAIKLSQSDSSLNVHAVAEIFMQANRLAELT